MLNETSAHYDQRGKSSLDLDDPTYGAKRFVMWASEPYNYLETLILPATKPSKVLDLCCGTGVHSIHPAKMGYQVLGIDISNQSIEASRLLALKNDVSGLCEFKVQTALEALDTKERYDIVIVSGSLYYLDLPKVLQGIRNVLTVDGQFICVETNGDNTFMSYIRRIRSVLKKDRDRATLGNLLGAQEISEFENYFHTFKVIYFDFFTLAGSLLTWCPPLARLYHAFARRIDRQVFKVKLLRPLAFKFLIQARS